eukprot:Nk52_evm1s2020 gene=Nk52_evmTU1s2020
MATEKGSGKTLPAGSASREMSRAAAGGNDDMEAKNAEDLAGFVQDLLQQMQDKFQNMSTGIINRIDDMETKIDDLEQSIGDLMTQAGMDDGAKTSGKVQ